MRYICAIVLSFSFLITNAQRQVQLRSGMLRLESFNPSGSTDSFPGFGGMRYAVMDFGKVLEREEQQSITGHGVELLNATSGVYLVRFSDGKGLRDLRPRPVFIGGLTDEVKVSEYLESAQANDKTIYVRLSLASGIAEEKITAAIAKSGGVITDSPMSHRDIISVAIPGNRLADLAALAPVLWIEPEQQPDEIIRYQSAANERATYVTDHWGLTGNGVTIGIGDGGKVGSHIDLDGHLENFAYGGISTHATHVSGIVTGRPNLNQTSGAGTAPGANVVTSFFSTIVTDAERHLIDHDLSVTNNSYGSSQSSCVLFGDYNLSSVFIDEQLADHDTLLHVFAAGNSGGYTCNPFPGGYATVLTGYQTTKNALCVGSITKTDDLSPFSSRGPVDDGRIKPDIVAVGSSVFSTRPGNLYAGGSGTSYSAPAVTGICALLSEKYQGQYGHKPPASLIRAALMNTADDLGNPGPDYFYGFGRVNARRAIELISEERFEHGTITQGDSIVYDVEAPSQSAQLRVMLMWTDPAAAPYATPVLVNDLDLVVRKDGANYLPWVLNPSPSGVTVNAARARDSLNNQEQVTLDQPADGVYSIVIRGTSIPMTEQSFVLVYEFVPNDIHIVYPKNDHTFRPGTTERIRWDAYGDAVGPFDVQYSIDEGEWQNIAVNYNSERRWVNWTVPDDATNDLAIRISADDNIGDTVSQNLAILDRPANFAVSSPCGRYAQMTWDEVASATHYGIYRYDGIDMQLVDTTSNTEYVISDLNQDEWLTVSAFSDSVESFRNTALQISPAEASGCPWPKDLQVNGIIQLTNGRMNTSSQLTSSEDIVISYVNIGSDTVFNLVANYAINELAPISEAADPFLPPGDTAVYTFTATADLSATGSYTIQAWMNADGDSNNLNDSTSIEIRQASNPPVSLPWVSDFEELSEVTLEESTFGFAGPDSWDYTTVSGPGRLRSDAGAAFQLNGTRSITLDSRIHNSTAVNAITATVNMSSYSIMADDVRLAFKFMHHEIEEDDDIQDIVEIRGSDTSAWLEVVDLFDLHGNVGELVHIGNGIPVSALLALNGQDFSSSFQLRFKQEGGFRAGDSRWEDGYTFDDIELFAVGADLELTEIISPAQVNCELGMETIAIRIRNTSDSILAGTAIAHAFEGDTIIEFVDVPPLADSIYEFVKPLDLTSVTTATFSAWIYHPDDDRNVNDSILNSNILNFPAISEMPYFEDFENGPAGWRTFGINSSFELGMPSNSIIRNAASGKNAWVTGLSKPYNTNEFSYLTSPCLNTSLLAEPYLSFAHIYEIENNYDFLWVEYSEDGTSWTKLGEAGQGFNWYNDPATDSWDNDNLNWRVASIALPQSSSLQIRFVMTSDVGLELEGAGIDAIHIHEAAEIYSGESLDTETLSASGNDWIDFSNSGQLVASVNPEGQDLGDLSLEYFNYTGSTRNDGRSYYMNRNAVISSTIVPSDSFRVRLYFDSLEVELLTAATGCDGCINPYDPFRVNGSKYSGTQEDSLFTNNTNGETEIFSYPEFRIIPMGEGYIAEFLADGFSEFWLTSRPVQSVDSIEVAISASSDDASEFISSGGVNPVADSLQMTSAYATGLRFTNVNIPPGSFIKEAHVEVTSRGDGGAGELLITGHKALNASGFTTGNYNITGRARTDRYQLWDVPANTSNDQMISPPLRTLIQEIVTQSGWTPGNSIALILEGNAAHSIHSIESDASLAARLIIAFDSTCAQNQRLYVDSSAVGARTGNSWADAFTDLQHALDLAAFCPNIEEVWLASGTYFPTLENRAASFDIRPGLRVYGGFDGTENNLEQRDPATNLCILSGDVGLSDYSADNSFRVVSIPGSLDTSVLDGVTVRSGFAFGPLTEQRMGAGIHSTGNLHLAGCIIEDCSSLEEGSGIYQAGSGMTIKLTNCTLRNNQAPQILNEGGSELIISNTNRLEINE